MNRGVKLTLILGIIILLCVPAKLSAQAMYFPDGTLYVQKVADNLYKGDVGVVSYRLDDGKFRILLSGEPTSDEPSLYFQTTESRINYYNSKHDLIGYCVLAEKRFYRTRATGNTILEETPTDVLFKGILYGGTDGSMRFQVDENFPLEWLGFFVFY